MAITRESITGKKHKPSCPECGSEGVLPIHYGLPNSAAKRALRDNKIILADCQDWEGLPQWHCKKCGCEWRGAWRSFKFRRV
jgi:ribosomal protein S27AE